MRQRVKEKVFTGNKVSKKYKIYKNIVKKIHRLYFRRVMILTKLMPRFQKVNIHLSKMMK